MFPARRMWLWCTSTAMAFLCTQEMVGCSRVREWEVRFGLWEGKREKGGGRRGEMRGYDFAEMRNLGCGGVLEVQVRARQGTVLRRPCCHLSSKGDVNCVLMLGGGNLDKGLSGFGNRHSGIGSHGYRECIRSINKRQVVCARFISSSGIIVFFHTNVLRDQLQAYSSPSYAVISQNFPIHFPLPPAIP